jgi:hypothetical protein
MCYNCDQHQLRQASSHASTGDRRHHKFNLFENRDIQWLGRPVQNKVETNSEEQINK